MADDNLKKDRKRAIRATEKASERLRKNLTREAKNLFAKGKKSSGDAAKHASGRSEAFMKAISRETEGFINKVFKSIEKGAHAVVERTEAMADEGKANVAQATAGEAPAKRRVAKKTSKKPSAAKRPRSGKSAARKVAAKRKSAPRKRSPKKSDNKEA